MQDKYSKAVQALPLSIIREIFNKSSEYEDVISLGIGEPDFDTDPEICKAALEDALKGYTHYAPSQGDKELLVELASYLTKRYDMEISPGQVLVTSGGMCGLSLFFVAMLDPGDEVLVPEPFFPPYQAHISLAGGKMVQVPTSFDQGFSLKAEDVEKAITPKTKVLVLNTPNNPTGALLKKEDLDQLAEIAIRHDLIVISDEVYDRIIFGGASHDSIYTRKGMAERTLVLGSFSKAYAMTGWRLGWLFGSEDLIKGVLKVVTFNTASASTISQRGALAALKSGDAVVEKMASEFGKRCEYVYERLKGMPGVDVHRPQGSFYIFPRIKGLPKEGLDFALELLDKKQLAVVPGDAFGPSGAGCLRLACTLKQEKLAKAMDRLEEFLNEKKI